jgi:hypothetical protein
MVIIGRDGLYSWFYVEKSIYYFQQMRSIRSIWRVLREKEDERTNYR